MTVHVVEPGGWGGIYQHAASLAAALAAAGTPVVFHTAADAEELGLAPAVPRHACFWRFRQLRPPPVRRAAIAAAWLAVGVPSSARRFRPGDIVHIEGWFFPGMMLPLAVAARLRRCALSLSPHLTFSRRGRAREVRIEKWLARRADVVFFSSERDRERAGTWGIEAVPAPLLVPPATPDEALVEEWRARWGPGRVVLFAGQVRADKGLDVAVRAAARWGPGVSLAVVGEDIGALGRARALAAQLDVRMEVDEGYQPLARFVAAIAAADVVVCPYLVASQSSILTLANSLGRPSVASDIGGLPELATVTVPPRDPDALAIAVSEVLRSGGRDGAARRPGDPARAYLDAFGRLRTA